MLICVIFILCMCNMVLAVNLHQCVGFNSDCNPGDSIVCGICADDHNSGRPECQFIFDYKYPNKNEKCDLATSCPNDCSANGLCISILLGAGPSCLCQTHYGFDCGLTTPPELVNKFPLNGVAINSPTVFKPAGTHNVDFHVVTSPDYDNPKNPKGVVKHTVRNDHGSYTCTVLQHLEPIDGGNFLTMFRTYVRFPYLLYTKTDSSNGISFLKRGNLVLGYVSTITATAELVEPQFTFWTYNWKVAVLYDGVELTCVADIRLFNCGNSRATSSTYFPYQKISLASQITYIANGFRINLSKPKPECNDGTVMTWLLWKEDKDILDENNPPIKEQYRDNSFNFERFSLDFGHYLARAEVKSYQTKPSITMSTNIAYCFFNVRAQALIPVIDGGDEITILRRFGISLSAKQSKDPNSSPSDQDHLFATWSCVNQNDPSNVPSFCKEVTLGISEVHFIPEDQLSYGSKFIFYLILWTNKWDSCKGQNVGCEDVSPKFASVKITIPKKGDKSKDSILIQCVKNCAEKVIPNQQLFLKAVSLSNTEMQNLEWTIIENTKNLEVSDMIIPNVPSFMLLIKENKLKMGAKYTVAVQDASVTHEARYNFETHTFEYEGNCTINPESGEKGETLFCIYCDPGDVDFNFDFYNKHPEESTDDHMFSGRMLGSSTTGQLHDVKLTREKVIVYIISRVGLFSKWSIDVKLRERKVGEKVFGEFSSDLDIVIGEGNDMKTLQYMSFIPDVVPDSMDKSQFLNKLLDTISLIALEFATDVKMETSTLSNILVGLNKPRRLKLNTYIMMKTLSLMHKLASLFSYLVSVGESFQAKNSPKELFLIAKALTEALNIVLVSRVPAIGNEDPDYFDFETLNVLMKGSVDAENILGLIQDVLAYIQPPGLPPIQVSSSDKAVVMWVMENDDSYPITNYLDGTIPVAMSSAVVRSLAHELHPEETLVLQIATMTDNIFWWCKSDVKSNLVSVSLSKVVPTKDIIKITNVSKPILVRLQLDDNVEGMKVTGKAKQPNTTLTPVELDRSVEVHRLEPKAGSLTVVKFLYPPTKHKLRVVIKSAFRPDYDIIVDESVTISEESPVYPVPLIHKEDQHFLFIGILPAADVSIGEEVPYSFEIDSKLCQHWTQGQWSSSGCKISLLTKGADVVCSCDHFSIFSAAFPVPPQEINPFDDVSLFLTVHENPLVFVFVLIILLFYFLLCVWAICKDRADKYKRNVVILEDNLPGDRVPYLIAVYTSSRFNSGTTANVGLRIVGSLDSSRVHILASKNRRLLRKNSDDWFLIYCSQLLGNLGGIHIWHDNAGSDPDWHLDKIVVYSLEENIETVFVFEQWLALRMDEYPEALAKPNTTTDVTSVKRMFLDNCVIGLRETHVFLSIIIRHPRSRVSRLQRVNTVMVGVMVAMLCSIMFYVPNESEGGIDDPEYDVSMRDLYISMQTLVLSVLSTITIFFAFKRSYKIVKSDCYTGTKVSEDENRKEERSVYGKFVKFLTRNLKSNTLTPVLLPHSESLIVVRKVWLIIAWTLCISVILISSYLIIMYGFKLGAVKSKKWLTSVLLTVGEDVLVQGPGKIVLISTMLSLALQTICQVDKHRISLHGVRGLEAPNDEGYVVTLLEKRRHPMYAPLRSDVKNVMIEKKQFYHNCWLITDFSVSVLFVVNVCVAIFWFWNSLYYANSQVVRILTTTYYVDNDPIDFFQVKNIQDLEKYFKYGLIKSLYTTRWYNNDVFEDFKHSKQYWNDDCIHKMLGLPMLRQLRVFPKSCNNVVLDGRKQCIPVWSYSVEDNVLYGPGWKSGSVSEMYKQNSPWIYKDRSISKSNTRYRLYGASGRLYDNGGFSVTLGPSRQDTESVIAELLDRHWQDLLTKVVFLELTLYNVNQDLFSQATLTAEYLISGNVQLKAQSVSVQSRLELGYLNVYFVLFFIFYLVRAARIINHSGLLDYMKSVRNVTRLLVLVLCVLCYLTAGFHLYLSMNFHSEFQKQTHDSYFDFDSFVFHFSNLKTALLLLFCVAVFRMMILFRGGRRFLNYIYTIKISWNWIFWLTAITVILVMFLVQIALFFNIFGGLSVLELVNNQKVSRYFSAQEMINSRVQIFFFLKAVCLAVIKSFFVVTFMYSSKIAKTYNKKQSDHFSFIGFLLTILTPKKCRKERNPTII